MMLIVVRVVVVVIVVVARHHHCVRGWFLGDRAGVLRHEGVRTGHGV